MKRELTRRELLAESEPAVGPCSRGLHGVLPLPPDGAGRRADA